MTTPPDPNVVVAGVDGSDTSLDAARWAASVAHRMNATLLLAHALPQSGALLSPAAVLMQSQFLSQLREDGEAIIDGATKLVRSEFPDLDIEYSIGPESAGSHLLEEADDARMLVLGATGAGAVRSLFVGSTALHVANRATCPVTVWRGSTETALPDERPVVVGVDGSSVSDHAVVHAFEFADLTGAPLTAVHAWRGSSALGAGGTEILVDWKAVEQEESALLSEGLAGMSERFPDVSVTHVTEQGSAAEVLIRQARTAQLIVVGSHGRGPIVGALMGSTSQNLLHHAPCPVTICRP